MNPGDIDMTGHPEQPVIAGGMGPIYGMNGEVRTPRSFPLANQKWTSLRMAGARVGGELSTVTDHVLMKRGSFITYVQDQQAPSSSLSANDLYINFGILTTSTGQLELPLPDRKLPKLRDTLWLSARLHGAKKYEAGIIRARVTNRSDQQVKDGLWCLPRERNETGKTRDTADAAESSSSRSSEGAPKAALNETPVFGLPSRPWKRRSGNDVKSNVPTADVKREAPDECAADTGNTELVAMDVKPDVSSSVVLSPAKRVKVGQDGDDGTVYRPIDLTKDDELVNEAAAGIW